MLRPRRERERERERESLPGERPAIINNGWRVDDVDVDVDVVSIDTSRAITYSPPDNDLLGLRFSFVLFFFSLSLAEVGLVVGRMGLQSNKTNDERRP